jgi:hypothetical protein
MEGVSPAELQARGYEELHRFMTAQAKVAGTSMFLTFTLGQLGALNRVDRDRAREVLELFKSDVADLEQACDDLRDVLGGLVGNMEASLS